ncbi:MAG: CDP-alcohol phosphatidyltransferase family protein [Bacteroidota bacterium]|nr:CDP-alcohol phosphatidyltransferase family protein [Bacteroidota bacterium]
MKQIPNILSCSRIVLSVVLFFLIGETTSFIIVYLLCGISDVADGYLARRLTAETRLGAKLDSLADFIFWCIALYALWIQTDVGNDLIILWGASGVVLIRMVNFLITKSKFKQWGMIHTIGNKATGLILFLLLPIYFYEGRLPGAISVSLVLIAMLSAIEESIIIIASKTYDVNRKSIFSPKEI